MLHQNTLSISLQIGWHSGILPLKNIKEWVFFLKSPLQFKLCSCSLFGEHWMFLKLGLLTKETLSSCQGEQSKQSGTGDNFYFWFELHSFLYKDSMNRWSLFTPWKTFLGLPTCSNTIRANTSVQQHKCSGQKCLWKEKAQKNVNENYCRRLKGFAFILKVVYDTKWSPSSQLAMKLFYLLLGCLLEIL